MGLDDKYDGMCMDARAFAGNFLFSTGTDAGWWHLQNAWPLGDSAANCDVTIDNTAVVIGGKAVGAAASIPT